MIAADAGESSLELERGESRIAEEGRSGLSGAGGEAACVVGGTRKGSLVDRVAMRLLLLSETMTVGEEADDVR